MIRSELKVCGNKIYLEETKLDYYYVQQCSNMSSYVWNLYWSHNSNQRTQFTAVLLIHVLLYVISVPITHTSGWVEVTVHTTLRLVGSSGRHKAENRADRSRHRSRSPIERSKARDDKSHRAVEVIEVKSDSSVKSGSGDILI